MDTAIQERFDVEWNAGAGWQCNTAHHFWTKQKAIDCMAERQASEKLAKWPMRLMHTDLATGDRQLVQ